MTHNIKYNIQTMIRKHISLNILPDSLSLFDENMENTITTERDLRYIFKILRNLIVICKLLTLLSSYRNTTYPILLANWIWVSSWSTALWLSNISHQLQQWTIRNALFNEYRNDDLIVKAGSVKSYWKGMGYLEIYKV